jgi:glutathione S-transferase
VTRTLYSGTKNASSWAFRAWLALRESGVAFEERVVEIPRPQRYANLAEIGRFSPPAAVPVLVDDGAVIFDSLAIMEYANELGGGCLLPGNARLRARARSLVAWVHSGMSNLCSGVSFESAFFGDRRRFTETETREAARVFALWERELGDSGGPYLLGALSLADLAFVPTVVRLLSRTPNLAQLPRCSGWTERLLSRASVSEWMTIARELPPVPDA